ncbi:MAG: CoA transferase [Betaproteobacteria bacterium]|nr:MAG: CoA transferase [Betaproteobacteria bacterium]
MTLPLDGILVLELSHIIAGPYCGSILADYGAECIKIEAPGSGDRGRSTAPLISTSPELSGFFYTLGRSRKGITLDLKNPDGKQVFLELVERADVVLENFRPGTMEKLGLGYEALREANPRIIYAAISGFGQMKGLEGPYSKWPANNAIAQAMGGLSDLSGGAGDPVFVGASIGDTIPAIWAALGIVLAIEQRHRTGLGQFIDVAMYDTMASICWQSVAAYSARGRLPARGGEGWLGTFTTILRCGKGHIAVSLWGDQPQRWKALYEMMGHPEYFDDPRYNPRTPGADEVKPHLRAALETWLADKTAWEATQALVKLGFSVGPVQNAKEVHDCAHLEARRAFIEIEVGGRKIRSPGAPVRMSETPLPAPTRAPHLGEHTDDVLRRLLGYSDEKLQSLHAKRAC